MTVTWTQFLPVSSSSKRTPLSSAEPSFSTFPQFTDPSFLPSSLTVTVAEGVAPIST